jgi:hypothetical protein
MKQLLNDLAEALRGQALALQTVADEVTALKRMLATRDAELAEELKAQIQGVATQMVADRVTTLQQTLMKHDHGLAGELQTQVEADQEKNRAKVYELQVNLATLQEAIANLPDAGKPAGKERAPRARKVGKKLSRKRV